MQFTTGHIILLTDTPVSQGCSRDETPARKDGSELMASLKSHLELLLSNDLTPASRQLYKRAFRLYAQFYQKCFQTCFRLPISSEELALFISYLHANRYAAATVSSYISALGYVHRLKAIPDPTTSFIIKRLLRCVHRTASNTDSKLPITECILHQLIESLPFVTRTLYDRVLFRSMFLLAFFAFLRIGEITTGKDSPQNTIKYNAVKLFGRQNVPSRLEIVLSDFKWQQSHRPTMLSIPCNTSNPATCPVKSLMEYMSFRGSSEGPLFCHPPNKGISRAYFNQFLHKAVQFAGYDPNKYKSHSFRIGVAIKAAILGFSELDIQHMGRWGVKLSLQKKYVRVSLTKCPTK